MASADASSEARNVNNGRRSSNGNDRCFIIGVAGGTASGKTTVCKCIIESLSENNMNNRIVILSQDSFYKPLTPAQQQLAGNGKYNFDHPDAFDTELMLEKILQIRAGETVEIPIYDFVNHCRSKDVFKVFPTDIILIEGILVLYIKELRSLMDMKLFVDTDSDIRLSRRVQRDIETRGRKLENVLIQYTAFVKPAFEEFCLPTKKYADVIIPRGGENKVAIGLIVQHITDLLNDVPMIETGRRKRGSRKLSNTLH